MKEEKKQSAQSQEQKLKTKSQIIENKEAQKETALRN
jgi:hypothetical protein